MAAIRRTLLALPMSAILVKMPPATRNAAAPSDSPMANPK
jgi:hypothetical protein